MEEELILSDEQLQAIKDLLHHKFVDADFDKEKECLVVTVNGGIPASSIERIEDLVKVKLYYVLPKYTVSSLKFLQLYFIENETD